MLPVERVEIRDFKCIEHLELDLVHPDSELGGHWTCVAGINGAGKTSVLQAIALSGLGEFALEVGHRRLQDALRRGRYFYRIITQGLGDISQAGSGMLTAEALEYGVLLLGYGATRNLSDYIDRRHHEKSVHTRRVISLFDPLTQVASAEALLGGAEPSAGWVLFAELLEAVFPGLLQLQTQDGARWLDERPSVRKAVLGTPDGPTAPLDLPDGYRSTLAWLADLCFQHAEVHPEVEDLAEVEALVLLDEIELHLHPALQRSLVPALREALPGVQWVVTTHSPLVLSCFDRHEIIALDRDAPGGVRALDRQILGFSADEVYQWLMGTQPRGGQIEAVAEREPARAAELLAQSEEIDEEQARAKLHRRRELLSKLMTEK